MTNAIPIHKTTEATFDVYNPFNGEVIDKVTETDPTELLPVIKKAKCAAESFRFSMPYERRALLNKLADVISENATVLAKTVCKEVGKTIAEATNEIRRAQNTLRLSGDAATFLEGEVLHCGIVSRGVNRQAVITHVPVGVVAAITPFNYPVNLLCHKLGPALAAGNAIIIKPSPKAPLAAQILVDLCKQAGFPDNLVQMVHGGAKTAQALACSPIDLLSFTGGPEAGLALKQASGLVRCLMELGGNDPLIVLPDANLEDAAQTAINQRFEIAGQSCAAVKKLYLHNAIKKDFIDILLSKASEITTGDPEDNSTKMGPVIDELAAVEVKKRLDEAVSLGGEILMGGNHKGTMIEPTIIHKVEINSSLFQNETFGPIISIREFSDIKQLITEVNSSDYGLQAGIYSNNHEQIKSISKSIQVGGVMINEGPDFRAEHVPFGGIKKSGLGREGVRIALKEMSETKVIID
ncbi:MAG: aldehyde dehydrogenase family protein [Gammaproteobacteria bacterium]|nr:aldehyde dehydrogenase family protein [Gammaproteobacteria bacterium]